MPKYIDNPIDLKSSLSIKNAFGFPLQNKESRKEIVIGAIWMLVPFIGWILNMGHRISFVRKMQYGKQPFPSWLNYKTLAKDGIITLIGMLYYTAPGLLFFALYYVQHNVIFIVIGVILFLISVVIIPGYMSVYCYDKKALEIFKVQLVFKSIYNIGFIYWKAWLIVLAALALSFLGLLFFGIGFLFTSVWFWQVAGYCFANIFTERYQLEKNFG